MRYSLLAIILVSACVSTQQATPGLTMKMEVNPQELFSEGATTVTIDVENQDVKTLREVTVDVFETGSLTSGTCEKNFGSMDPKDFKTAVCNLNALKVDKTETNTVWARARYKSVLAAAQTFDIISQAEYETKKKAGKFVEGQKSFSFKDSNLELAVELSNAPLIDAPGKAEFVTFSIKNIGNGFIEKLGKDDIRIKSSKKDASGSDIVQCPQNDIFIIGKEFPRISCRINLNGDAASFITAQLSINIDYDYEIRDKVIVTTVK